VELKVLRVNLSDSSMEDVIFNDKTVEKFIGGRCLAVKILLDETPRGIDPLGPENKLIFLTGPVTGTPFPSSGRFHVSCKSPITGGIGDADCGGDWGPELRFAGYDGIIFEGKAKKPVYLWINDGKAEIRDASKYWGKTVNETEDMLHAELDEPKAKIVSIGPGGENQVLYAAIMNRKHRAAGRSGVGTVMGSKNLKAVVVRGSGRPPIADLENMKATRKRILAKLKENPTTGEGMPTFGTSVLVDATNGAGILPTYNFKTGVFDGADKINAAAFQKEVYTKSCACWGCPVACGKVSGDGEGPEYEAIALMGASCGIDDPHAITKAFHLCNNMGIDAISYGGTLACAMEMVEQGKIPTDKLNGEKIAFGSTEALIDLVRKTALREGFGDDLAMGSKRLAEKYGSPESAMHVKGLELPGYDPRGSKGQGLAYATSPRGGCHVRSFPFAAEVAGWPIKLDPFTVEGKENITKAFQEIYAMDDSLVVCKLLGWALDAQDLTDLLNAVTGWGWSEDDFMKAGERVWNIEKLYMLREGFTRKDDTLPRRFLEEPMPEGPAQGETVDLETMLDAFYALCGWDENGIPLEEKLDDLGLSEYAIG